MKKIVCSFLLLLISVFLLSCQDNKPLPVLRLGHAPHDHHSPFYIAAMNPGYFKEHGGIYLQEITYQKEYRLVADNQDIATVVVDSSTGGKELIRKLSEEYFDLSFGGFPAMLHFIDQGNPIKILAPVMTEGAGLVVAKDLPVSNWDEFVAYAKHRKKPLKIGYKSAVSVQNIIFEHALHEAQVTYTTMQNKDPKAKVVGVNLHGSKNLIPGLENGLVGGFVTMQPYLALAEEKGVGKTITMLSDMPPYGKWKGVPCCALAANNNYTQAYPEVSEALVVLMLRANQFINDNPVESAKFVSTWLNVPEVVELKALPTINFTTSYSESWNNGVDFWTDSMIKSGRLQYKIKDAYEAGRLVDEIYNRSLYDKARGQL